jgi:hypothetical protein
VNRKSRIFQTLLDICSPFFDNIVPRSDFVLPNGNEKRQREAAIETATRSGKQIAKICKVPTGKFSLWFRTDVRYYAERLRGWGEDGRHPGENINTEQSKNPTALQFSWA